MFDQLLSTLKQQILACGKTETRVLNNEMTKRVEAVLEVVKSGQDITPWLDLTFDVLLEILVMPHWVRRLTALAAITHVVHGYSLSPTQREQLSLLLSNLIHDEKREVRDAVCLVLVEFSLDEQFKILLDLILECDDIEPSQTQSSPYLPEGCATYIGYILSRLPTDEFISPKYGKEVLTCLQFLHKCAEMPVDSDAVEQHLRWHTAKALCRYLNAALRKNSQFMLSDLESDTIRQALASLLVHKDVRCRKSASEALALFLYATRGKSLYLYMLRDAPRIFNKNLCTDAFDPFTHSYCCMLSFAMRLQFGTLIPDIKGTDSGAPYFGCLVSLYKRMSMRFSNRRDQSGIYQNALLPGIVTAEYHAHSSDLYQSIFYIKHLLSQSEPLLLDGGLTGVHLILTYCPTFVFGLNIRVHLFLLSHHSSLPIAIMAKKVLLLLGDPFPKSFIIEALWHLLGFTRVENGDIQEAAFKALEELLQTSRDEVLRLNPHTLLSCTRNTPPQKDEKGETRPLIAIQRLKVVLESEHQFLALILLTIEASLAEDGVHKEFAKVAALDCLEPLIGLVLQWSGIPDVHLLLKEVFLILSYATTFSELAPKAMRASGAFLTALMTLQVVEEVAPVCVLVALAIRILTYAYNAMDDEGAELARTASPAAYGFLKWANEKSLLTPGLVCECIENFSEAINASIDTQENSILPFDHCYDCTFLYTSMRNTLGTCLTEQQLFNARNSPNVTLSEFSSGFPRAILFTILAAIGPSPSPIDSELMDRMMMSLILTLRAPGIDEEYLAPAICYAYGVFYLFMKKTSAPFAQFASLLTRIASRLPSDPDSPFCEFFEIPIDERFNVFMTVFTEGSESLLERCESIGLQDLFAEQLDMAADTDVSPEVSLLRVLLDYGAFAIPEAPGYAEVEGVCPVEETLTVLKADLRSYSPDSLICFCQRVVTTPLQNLFKSGAVGYIVEEAVHLLYGCEAGIDQEVKNQFVSKVLPWGRMFGPKPPFDVKATASFTFA